jgi:hypothetical protein
MGALHRRPLPLGEFTNCARDLELPELAASFTHQSINESARQRRARRGALSTYALATSQLQSSELDTACDTAQRAATLANTVQSVRLSQALSDLQRRLAPHRHEPAVAAFNEHIEQLARH